MDETTRKKNIAVWVFIAVLFLILIYGIGRLLGRTPNTKRIPTASTPSSTSVVKKESSSTAEAGSGILKLALQDNGNIVSTSEQAVVRVIASSGAKAIVGYDIVISYDPSVLKYININHPLVDYATSVHAGNGRLNVSGFLRKQDTKPWIFSDTVIEELRFQPLKAGKTMVTLTFSPGATDESNLMSGDSHDLLSQVTPLSISVGTPLQLNLNETKKIDNSTYSLRLDRINIPSATCRDCFTSQDLTLIDSVKNKQSAIGFRTGGFAGVMHDEVQAGGFLIKLGKSTTTDITVIIAAE